MGISLKRDNTISDTIKETIKQNFWQIGKTKKISKITTQAAKACPKDMKTQLLQPKHQKRFNNMANLKYFKYI